MCERVVIQGWRTRLELQVQEARRDVWSHGADHQGARTAQQIVSFMGLKEALHEGILRPPQAEPRTARLVSKAARQEALSMLRQVHQLKAERYDACAWHTEPQVRDLDQVKSEQLAIRRENWADRKAEDPTWYSTELAYNAQRRRLKPPPSAKGEDRNTKQRAALERLKADPVAYAEYRSKRAEQCRQSRLRHRASEGVSGS